MPCGCADWCKPPSSHRARLTSPGLSPARRVHCGRATGCGHLEATPPPAERPVPWLQSRKPGGLQGLRPSEEGVGGRCVHSLWWGSLHDRRLCLPAV